MSWIGALRFQAGDLEKAETYFQKAAENGRCDAMSNLGSLLIQRGDLAEARAWYQQSAEAGDASGMYGLGYLLQKSGEIDEAEWWFRHAHEAGSTNGSEALGHLLLEKGDLDAAEAFYRERSASGNAAKIFDLAGVLQRRGKIDEAKALLRGVADSGNPTEGAEALARLGDVLMVDGRFEEASTAFQAALENGHLSDPTRVQASLAMSSSITTASPTADSEQAIRNALAAAAPEQRRSYLVNLALLVMLKGDLDEAESLYREIIELGGDSVGTGWEGLGSVYMTAGRVDEAIAAYQAAIEKGGSSAVSGLAGLGGALGKAGRLEEAEHAFRKVLTSNSTTHYGIAWVGLGEVFSELNRLDDARATFGRAIECGPENVRELALTAIEKLAERD